MFKDKIFNISFLISLFFHLFCMSVITIITVPTGLSLANYSKVYFLGPILEKTAFEFMLEESPVKVETLYRRPLVPQYTFDVEIKLPEEKPVEPVLEPDSPFAFNLFLKDIIRENKMITPHFFKEISSVLPEDIGSRSPLESRAVAFKPDKIPKVPIWITQNKESFKIKLEFTVSPQGNVEGVKPIVSSGYPQVDMIGMDYLRKWRFTPLQPSEEQGEEIGNIEIELK